MASFKERTKTRIHLSRLKADPAGWIEIYTKPSVAEVEAMQEHPTENNVTNAIMLLTSLIQAWGFTDEAGNPEPVTVDNVRRLEPEDLVEINEALEATAEVPAISTQKKTS